MLSKAAWDSLLQLVAGVSRPDNSGMDAQYEQDTPGVAESIAKMSGDEVCALFLRAQESGLVETLAEILQFAELGTPRKDGSPMGGQAVVTPPRCS